MLKAISGSNNFQINGLLTVHMQLDMAEEFLRVYRHVLPDYSRVVEQMTSGKLLALLIAPTYSNETPGDIVNQFRDFCGPVNCELARLIYPKSLRALAGNKTNARNSIVENGIHCTDLPEDSAIECSFFFDVLAKIQL